MRPQRLDHVVFAVRDLDSAAAAWKRLFGLEAGQRLQPDVIQADIALMEIGGAGSDSSLLELATPLANEGPVADALAARGEGMLSISLAVEDVDAAVAELQAAGVPISDVEAGPIPGTRVARLAAADAHGVRLQLIERPTS